jgi:RNA recognition motif-containing protein
MPRSTSRRSHSKSQSRSRSRTRSRTRSNSRNGDRRGDRRDDRRDDRNGYKEKDRYSNNNDLTYNDLCRVHIADLTEKVTKSDIEKAFGKYGELDEVWMAKNPPCFAFCVYKNKDDANDAIKEMDGRYVLKN